MAHAEKDFYKLLGVADKATAKEIRSAFHKLAKKLHPDRNPGNKDFERKFKDVSEAYETLSDTKKRQAYDQMRELGAHGFRFPGGAGAAGGAGQFDPSQFAGFNFGNDGGLGGLGDIFEKFLHREGRAGRPEAPRRPGADLHATADIPIATAARGGSVSLTLEGIEVCPVCRGGGSGEAETCPQCKGTGKSSGLHGVLRPCVRCGGQGRVPSAACSRCGGRGEVRETRKLSVKIPPGSKEGAELRLPGQGNRGAGGAGDLYLKLHITPDGDFRLEGADTIHSVTLSVFQAMLGSAVEISTLLGEKLRLKVPAGTQPGTRMRMRGKGLAGGDQLVEILVRVPKELTPAQKEQVQKLAAQLGEER